MSIPGSASPLLLASTAAAPTGFQVSRSLRFNPADSAYLSRTPAVAGNRRTWTWAAWVKRSGLGTQILFNVPLGGGYPTSFLMFTSNQLRFGDYDAGSSVITNRVTSAVYRDTSAWMHIVLAIDYTSSQAKIYVNGVEVTAFDTSVGPSNVDGGINASGVTHSIGQQSSSLYFDGYLANIHFIDGQALTPSSFTETDATTGQLIPKTYTGSYGTNGFNLLFADNSSNTASTLGKDTSGLGNNFTPNNFSVTAGAGNDSLVDSPTNYGTDTGVGGSVRGNYATLNPLNAGPSTTLSNGNLFFTFTSASSRLCTSTIGMSSGKWYWEGTFATGDFSGTSGLGIAKPPINLSDSVDQSNVYAYHANGQKFVNGDHGSSFGATYTTSDIIGIAFNADTGELFGYKNGTLQGTIATGLTVGPYFSVVNSYSNSSWDINYGQRAFAYTAPSGFKALCTQNLPAPLVTKSNTVFDVALWTGDGTSPRTISGLGFSPDLVWTKDRSIGGWSHCLYDVIRGNAVLHSNLTSAETATHPYGYVSSFNSDGFTLTAGSSGNQQVNQSSATYVGWTWDAGTSTVSNTQGSITSQVRANATAGFSVVTATKTSGTHSVGHGLGVTPSLIIVKNRAATSDWIVAHSALNMSTQLVYLNKTDSVYTSTPLWGGAPTSSVFYVAGTMLASNDFVAYCFAPVVGYSSFGSYTGNGSSDGSFVYTGFRPRWIMTKRTNTTGEWWISDAARDTYNAASTFLWSQSSGAEASSYSYDYDILSNGFKLRTTYADRNASGSTFIYAAFAEAPLNYSRAR